MHSAVFPKIVWMNRISKYDKMEWLSCGIVALQIPETVVLYSCKEQDNGVDDDAVVLFDFIRRWFYETQ